MYFILIKNKKEKESYKSRKQIFEKNNNIISNYFNDEIITIKINTLLNIQKSIPFTIVEKINKSIFKINRHNFKILKTGFFISYNSLNYFFPIYNTTFISVIVKVVEIIKSKFKLLNLKKRKNKYIKYIKKYINIINLYITDMLQIRFISYDNINNYESLISPIIIYIILTNTFININLDSKILNNNILISDYILNKAYEFIYTSSNFLFNIFLIRDSFISPLKLRTILSPNISNIISQVKSLEYKESFFRMTEKIDKLNDLKLKTEATEALYLSVREVNLYQGDKQASLLKKLFLRKMVKYHFIAKEIIQYANRYNVLYYNSSKVFPRVDDQIILQNFSKEIIIPKYIKVFDSKEQHFIPIFQYINVRISHTIRLLISEVNKEGRNTEIFIGTESQMILYYNSLGYKRIALLKTNSSLQYYLFSNEKEQYLNKIVILGVGNETKLNHLLLQFKFSDIDLDKVLIRGSIESAIYENQKELISIINELKENIDTVFMGNRSLVLIEFAKIKYPNEISKSSNENDAKKISEKLLKEYHNLKTFEIGKGVYKFSYFELQIKTINVGIICFRMPNGSLARIATEIFIRKGIKHFITLGAGGSLTNISPIGTYQLIKSTNYNNNEHIILSDINIKKMKVELSELPLIENGNNITLDSPLIETKKWLTKVRNMNLTSVDVETYHIIKGIQRCEKFIKDTEFLLGIFISDVVGEYPLVEKIKSSKAWEYLPKLLNRCFEYIEKKIKEKFINKDSNDTLYANNVKSIGKKFRFNSL